MRNSSKRSIINIQKILFYTLINLKVIIRGKKNPTTTQGLQIIGRNTHKPKGEDGNYSKR